MAEIDELRRTQFGRLNSSGMVSLQNRDVCLVPMDDSSLEELHCNIVLMLGNVISSFPSFCNFCLVFPSPCSIVSGSFTMVTSKF